MCTIVLVWRVFAERPVLVAANRDEAIDRPAEPPSVWDTDPAILAPRDRSAGGTWIGYNEHGVCAAITNRWLDDAPSSDRSRGLLVVDALGESTAEDAAREVERRVAADGYDGFNLVVADERAALYLSWDGSLTVRPLHPGVHVIVNVGADGRYRIPSSRDEAGNEQADNADRLRATLEPEPGKDASAWLDRAGETIADHEYGVCVHGAGFGTRSSSLLALGDDRRYWYADGPPCRTDYECVEGQV